MGTESPTGGGLMGSPTFWGLANEVGGLKQAVADQQQNLQMLRQELRGLRAQLWAVIAAALVGPTGAMFLSGLHH